MTKVEREILDTQYILVVSMEKILCKLLEIKKLLKKTLDKPETVADTKGEWGGNRNPARKGRND